MIATNSPTEILKSVPTPEAVRQQLGESLRQSRLLRRLLRVSEATAKELQKVELTESTNE